MTYLASALSVIVLSSLGSGLLHAAENTCEQTGVNSPLVLHKDWIMMGWEKKKNAPEFIFANKMARYYNLKEPEGIYWDNFAPGEKQLFDNAVIYGANWEGLQAKAESVTHALTEGHSELIGDKVASTTIGFVGTITQKTGAIIPFNGRSQLGWQCDEGEWKIHQELNYAWVVKVQDIAHYYEAMKAGS
ncbi:hypothetical protein [Marinomonas transparens]|uniref:SnoaL-like domain-containing protein n=1 Tax=Marinomonas transparens TaxID=2795388 RepID=A0A934JTY9_9GAMM|nr:hypothetical protein [Marinomonas transparens]MBJ7537274.1 hypothetical protein [Marinomonas transparens]